MKRFLTLLAVFTLTITSCEDFLDKPPVTGLSDDKLIDMTSMEALINGAYANVRDFLPQYSLYASAMVRDVQIRNAAEYQQFVDHQLSTNMIGWIYGSSYVALGLVNRVAISDLDEMDGTPSQKNAVLGDMHFLRALIYFEMNQHFTLPTTGLSVPLITEPIGVNDRVVCSASDDIKAFIEQEIENARQKFESSSGIANYFAATALAARIYFFHKKYDLAYQRANELIEKGNFIIENDVLAAFVPGNDSKENIFSVVFNSADGSGITPVRTLFTAYRANVSTGWFSLNPDSELASLFNANPNDNRYTSFITESTALTYIDGKYSTDKMDYAYLRLPEMYLTRAESNIMANNAVVQQDIDDLNIIRGRALPGSEILEIPDKDTVLNLLLEERTKEMAIEVGDHYRNVYRLRKDIVANTQSGSNDTSTFSQYSLDLVFPFPENEVAIHGLNRNP